MFWACLVVVLASCKPSMAANEQHAALALKEIAAAEFDFRSNDRDRNQLNEFWTGDVAGLHHHGGLISRELAMADAAPLDGFSLQPVPYHGYLFIAMDLDEDGKPYREVEGRRNPARFGVCAYPVEPGLSGTAVYVVDSAGTVAQVKGATGPPRRYPK